LSEERRLAYEEAIRVPLIVRYPRIVRPGTTPGEIALGIDLAPTAVELAGLTPEAGIQGRSLVPIFENRARDWRSSFLVEYFSDTVFPRIRNMGYVAVRTTRHKYIQYQELQNMNELYDLEADPYEERNLMGTPVAGPVRERMDAELQRLLTETRYNSGMKAVK
jgi:N-acetylglucosamine-6-sulfatase